MPRGAARTHSDTESQPFPRQPTANPAARSYPGSTTILGFNDLKLLIDHGLHAHGFLVQALELAKTLHPLGPACACAPNAGRQLFTQRFSDEILE